MFCRESVWPLKVDDSQPLVCVKFVGWREKTTNVKGEP